MNQEFQEINEGAAFISSEEIKSSDSDDYTKNLKDPLSASLQTLSSGRQSSNLQAFFTLFKSFIGSAVFTLPFSFKNTGIGLSAIVTVLIGILTLYCMDLAVQVADSMKGKGITTLEKLTYEVLGKKVKLSVQITLMIMQVGICIGIFILADQFLDYSFCVYHIEHLCKNSLFKVLLFAGITIPLSLINNAHYFYLPGMIGGFFVLLTVGSQTFYDIQLMTTSPTLGATFSEDLKKFNFPELPLLFGVATYAFEGIGTLFSIRSAMAKPRDLPKLLLIEIILLLFLLVGFSVICALALRDDLPEIVLFSLPKDNVYYLIVQIGIVISNLVSYPIQFFPAVVILENTRLFKKWLFFEDGLTKNWVLRYGMRTLLICLMIFIASVAKSFNLFLNILGSCVFTYVGFILPVWLYHRRFPNIPKWKSILNLFVVIISVILGGIGTVLAIIKLAQYDEANYK